ncbi:transient-receptor-potential-like protein [Plakobranchus ocellatus]|uniref:Transient-receptor-potential-like protein n=1 Tax=Plakobranchus ocellatus TaxID=259542 RepID=A0AAV3YGN2_9GAST|nr:transient-receptor-potential-like protein [Plakobranchus ocellatus]
MDPQERAFLDAVEKGDLPSVARWLSGGPGRGPVSVNCTDMLGRSAIQIAVDNENIELVELLLKQEGVKIGDALLYAIREGVYRIVEMLIEHPSITTDMLGSEWTRARHVDDESFDYSPDISPVILAAYCNQFEILQLLLVHGATIDRPHPLSCPCRRCQIKVHADGLRHSLLRINTYRALASPAWISLTSPDPILTAFKLSWELDHLALRENEFKDSYIQLGHQCKKYACDLLEQCRSSDEVIAVLNKNSDVEEADCEETSSGESQDDPDKLTLSRLKLALKYEQKQVRGERKSKVEERQTGLRKRAREMSEEKGEEEEKEERGENGRKRCKEERRTEEERREAKGGRGWKLKRQRKMGKRKGERMTEKERV